MNDENLPLPRGFSPATRRHEKAQRSSCLFAPFCGRIPSVAAPSRSAVSLIYCRQAWQSQRAIEQYLL